MGKTVMGKEVYVSLEEVVQPEHSALVIVDMQNDYCSDGGHFANEGIDITSMRDIIPRVSGLTRIARQGGIPIIYLQNTHLRNGAYLSPSFIAHMLKRWKKESQLSYTLEGTWGHEIVDQIRPEPTDVVVKKHRPSGFFGTDLDFILRNTNRKTVVVTGVVTEGCVESTARDAWMRDYYVVILEDCIGSGRADLHNAQLALMNQIYHFVVSSKELLRVWEIAG